ncbi:hypothetical protein CVO77_08565 [Sphingopyxis lindanitolerans]|jgi:hypothetical protein|uniref:AttH domain-containing protein n=1 Tax=Sphingopyxis lindanitolerans TaxID=2054227 RepID=A0A2S8B847_9SPHN|nr:hypothetical protein [Sphingopyxis lindanitolerans]PQM28506.1 hypothetical protein CVO77_08565 [Sphingopyxis lindanitolerans]
MEAVFSDHWDCPHQFSDEPSWQESDCYWFYDVKLGVGGFHRIGQKPNKGTGQLMLFVFKTGGERFVLNSAPRNEVQLGADARQSRKQVVGSHTAEALGDGRMRYTWDEPESSADIEFYESFYTPRNWPSGKNTEHFEEATNSDGHLECGGRIRGKVRIGDNEYEIDALAHRDRSWGKRSDSAPMMHRYRMYTGTCGSELSFAGFFLDFNETTPMTMGFVDRNGKQEAITNLRVAVTFDYDGLTPLGSIGIMTLESGEQLRIESKVVQGFLTPLPAMGTFSQDNISTFEYGGKTGFVDLEMCTNPGRGSYIPNQADVSFLAIAEGLSKAEDYII